MDDNQQTRSGNSRSSNNRNRNRRNNNRNRNYSRNQNRNRNRRGRNHGRNRRPAAPPKRTTGQKILSVLTFGLLGKPTAKKRPNQNKGKPQRADNPKPVQKPKRAPVLHEVTSGRLYVGNLSYDAGEADLEELFNGVGSVVSAEVVTNARTQQSKGFAFVEMTNIDEAKRAVDVLHDQDFMGRKLLVSGARSEGPRDDAAA